MKKIVLLISIVYCFNLFAQEEKDKKITFTPFGQYGSSDEYKTGENPHEGQTLNTYGYGINVGYKFKSFTISSGIEYQQYGFSIKGILPSPTNQQSISESVVNNIRHNYIAVPLKYNKESTLRIGGKSVYMTLLAGLKANFFTSASLETKTNFSGNSEDIYKDNIEFEYKDFAISGSYGFLFHKKFGRSLTMKVGPILDIFHQNTTTTESTKIIPFKGSIFAGVTF